MSHASVFPAAESRASLSTAPEGWFGWSPFDRNVELRNDPYPKLNQLREEHPVHKTPLGHYRVFRHADVTRVLKELKVGVRTTDGTLPNIFVAHVGFRQEALLFDRDPWHAGTSGYPLRTMMKFAASGILGFSTAPLRWISRLG